MPNRFKSAETACPVCGGWDEHGSSTRCWGFLSSDGKYARCTRKEYAGSILPHAKDGTYVHKHGQCDCGKSHEWPGAPVQDRDKTITREYEYRDETGKLLFLIAKFPNGGHGAHKPGCYKKGEWNIDGTRRVLYRLPDLIHADASRWVFVTEGEKDADRLANLGFVAVSPPFGASTKWKDHPDYTEALRGRHVLICPDNDEPGHKHALEVATCLSGVAQEVRLLTFEVGEKGDVSDWLDLGHDKDELVALVNATPSWRSQEPAQQTLSNGHSNGHNVVEEAEVIAQVATERAAPPQKIDPSRLPFVSIAELAARPRTPLEWLVKDILVAREPTLISGMEGSFKSFFVMEMAICAALGLPFLGNRPTTHARVMMIDLENSRDRLCDRIGYSLARKGKTFEDLGAHFEALDRETLEEDGMFALNTVTIQRLANNIDDYQPTLVILDNITKSLPPGTDPNVAEQMQPLIQGLVGLAEKRKIAFILVDHDTKAGVMAAGWGGKLRLVGNTLHIIHDRRSGVSAVTCSRLRNADKFKPFGITVDREGVLVPVGLDDANGSDASVPEPRKQVLDALAKGAKTIVGLVLETGLTDKQIRPILKAECARKTVGRVGTAPSSGGRGPVLYGLLAHKDQTPAYPQATQTSFDPDLDTPLEDDEDVP